MIKRALSALRRNRDGNVAVTFAFTAIPILMALGFGIDYGSATQKRARMNAAADAAALSTVTPTMMAQTSAVAKLAAVAMFNAQIQGMTGITYLNDVNVQISDTTPNNTKVRVVTVNYSASATTMFGGILGTKSIKIAGNAASSATVTPNIDFYLMIDTSPSMEIAATPAGITKMEQATPSQSGCAFACHETNPAADNLGNPGGPTQDNYALAGILRVDLRMTMVTNAVTSMISSAQNTVASTGAALRVAGYTFDVAVNNPIPLTSNLAAAQTTAATIQPLMVYSENYLTSSTNNSDMDTNFDLAFNTLNKAMPTPGNGTLLPGDTPQEVLFIVTDGVADQLSNGQRIYTPFGADPTWCQQIKNRNIRIAVLYTTYNPLPTNGWYNTYISGEQPSIATVAQACASPGLYFKVDTGGDITAAMTTLFNTAVKSAHLTQ